MKTLEIQLTTQGTTIDLGKKVRLLNQRGAVAPFVAVLLFVIVVCVALVVDLGHVHSVKGQLQRAVDAAALAGARYVPNELKVDAVAIATAAKNTVDGQPLVLTADDVDIGSWDTDALGANPADRWETSGEPIRAVKVRAEMEVDHVFFFFTDSTEVVADAIAVAEPINPIFPMSIISCIPLDSIISNQGSLPGDDVCDIRYYSFSPDTEDTAAWSGLTFGGGAPAILQFLDPQNGREQFEKTIFTGLATTAGDGGLENAPPDPNASPLPPYTGNQPVELNIPYGLGKIGGETLAPPDSFPEPTNPPEALSYNTTTGIYLPYDPDGPGGEEPFDAMLDYNDNGNGELPRWYHLNDDGVVMTDDHFMRIWSMDGHLLKGPIPGSAQASAMGVTGESFADYQARLQGYYDGTLTPPPPFDDGRLRCVDPNIDGCLIKTSSDIKNAEATTIADHFTANGEPVDKSEVNYWPDYLKIMEQAGYPKVSATNGSVSTVLNAFFSNPEIADEDAETLNCFDNAPLAGQTLRIQVPVIFSGFCESWKAISNASSQHTLVYVGLGDFLMTRGWKNPGEYDCATPVTLSANNASECTATDFNPALFSADEFSDIGAHDLAAEGLFKLPQIDTAEASSLVRVFLVE